MSEELHKRLGTLPYYQAAKGDDDMSDDELIEAMWAIVERPKDDSAQDTMRAVLAVVREHDGDAWQPMNTAPADGAAILVLLNDSDIPHAVRWGSPDWFMTWDSYSLSPEDGPRCWRPIPPAPDAARGQE